MAYLTLSGLRKSFGAHVVVRDLDLEVDEGEFVSILGPSGCGKTTTLRMIAGFVTPDAGGISIKGERIDHLPSQRRGTAMVFQNYALFPHMTVFDNVAFGLRMRKVPIPEIRHRVQQVLEFVKLPTRGDAYPKHLSGGQQQRVALARALVLNPAIILLDEPLSNLDAKLRKDLRVELREIQKAIGITAIYVTHDLEEAFSLSDRVAVMNDGRLEQFATPVEIFTRPATAFVADFVGHSNLVEGVVKACSADGVVLDVQGLEVRAGTLGALAEAIGGRATIAVPTHLVRVSPTPIDLDNCFPAVVKHAGYLGSAVHLLLQVGDLVLNSDMRATPEITEIGSGARVWVGWAASDAIPIPAGRS